jgi:hypothetical protein
MVGQVRDVELRVLDGCPSADVRVRVKLRRVPPAVARHPPVARRWPRQTIRHSGNFLCADLRYTGRNARSSVGMQIRRVPIAVGSEP